PSVPSHRASRALHSFPTRRSSDLGMSRLTGDLSNDAEPVAAAVDESHQAERVLRTLIVASVLLPLMIFTAIGVVAYFQYFHAARSEEHTSELQSREKLVCRLLLEK